jgi:hypothetical protein
MQSISAQWIKMQEKNWGRTKVEYRQLKRELKNETIFSINFQLPGVHRGPILFPFNSFAVTSSP